MKRAAGSSRCLVARLRCRSRRARDSRRYPVQFGLAACSTDRVEIFRQMGIYVSRILNGARPADLPIMQPTKFELVINVKTAGSLGLKLPDGLQQLADVVIE
jgi:putative ABC transport system substrate-binding protein